MQKDETYMLHVSHPCAIPSCGYVYTPCSVSTIRSTPDLIVTVSLHREEKSARGARAADVAERAPMRPGGPVQLTSKSQQLNSIRIVVRHAFVSKECVCQVFKAPSSAHEQI